MLLLRIEVNMLPQNYNLIKDNYIQLYFFFIVIQCHTQIQN